MENILLNTIVSLMGIGTAWMGLSSIFPHR